MNKAEQLVEKSEAVTITPIEKMIQNSIPELQKMLGGDETAAARFARIITTDCRTTPDLLLCTPLSFMGALFTAAELKLEPVAGRAYLLPFNNKKKVGTEWKTIKEVQFVLGYKGVVDLFYRHAKGIALSWGVVHEGDDFEFEKGSSSLLRHKRTFKDRGPKLAYWVGANVNGEFLFEVMSYDECIAHGKQHSKSCYKGEFGKNSPWLKSEDSMCLKTVLIQLSKTLPLSVEVQKAIQADESTRYIKPEEVGKLGSVIDLPDQTTWNESAQEELTTEPTEKEKENGK